MIICINCNTDIKSKMDILIGKGSYKDYSELIAVAVENLLMMEREVAEKGALVITKGNASSVIPIEVSGTDKTKPYGAVKSASSLSHWKKAASASPVPVIPVSMRIPDLFLLNELQQLSVPTEEIPNVKKAEEPYTLDQWLFGQYNKLLPIKANCRALIRLVAGQKNNAPLDITATRIAEAAMSLGDYLVDHDRRHQIGRDDALTTAFPRSGPDAVKSCARYANQFVGTVNSQGVLFGLLQEYRMVTLAPGEGAHLLLTKPAVEFSLIPNPVLDTCQTNPAQKFSLEEIEFLFQHIRSYVPVEAFAFRTLIQAIINGADTPDKLDGALRSLVPTDSNRSLSPSFLTSQRSGALSRMSDLGLITRTRRGVKVSYTITKEGETFMEIMGYKTKKEII